MEKEASHAVIYEMSVFSKRDVENLQEKGFLGGRRAMEKYKMCGEDDPVVDLLKDNLQH